MKTVKDIKLESHDISAIKQLQKKISKEFNINSIILFGSAARGENDIESDIDILVITNERLSRSERHKITDIAFDINMEYQTNISKDI